MTKVKTVAVSGYFDPIHIGHLEYFKLAKELGDKLIVIVNNTHQCVLKKGKPFMDLFTLVTFLILTAVSKSALLNHFPE